MFVAMIDEAEKNPGKYRFDRLKKGVAAGSVVPDPVMRRINDVLGIDRLTIAYGMTETSPVTFQTTVDMTFDKRVSTVGRVHPHVECKVVHPETLRIQPRGVEGEIKTRGYTTMIGYWNDE